MKGNRVSVKWKIFYYILGFVGVLLILLWLMQTVFLDSFYKDIKTRSIKSYGERVSQYIKEEDYSEKLSKINSENYINIRIVNDKGKDVYMSNFMPDSLIHKLSPYDIYVMYDKTLKHNGESLEFYTRRGNLVHNEGQSQYSQIKEKDIKSLVYTKVSNDYRGNNVLIMLNTQITPVNSTVETIRVQLVYISVILIVLSVILAFLISKKISKPIIIINESAKELARGNYNVVFKGEGYLEIEELNSTLNYASNELSKVDKLRKEIIANISHDLRTPLTMITGYGEIIRDIEEENTQENIQIIIDEAKSLSKLVTDILDISKIESGNQNVILKPINITKSINSQIQRYSKLVESEGYKIEFNYDSNVFVLGDEVKLSQVIYNTINNGINYTGKDKKVIVNQVVDREYITIEVIDSGNGISEEMIPHIWERYYRGEENHKRDVVGSGLGLSIVKEIINIHGGECGVDSEKGKGSRFWFKLKRVRNI
ncbi:MAG: HAMP domain-containing sensor histidine kinase [Peptostreptococcaceae bacterium]